MKTYRMIAQELDQIFQTAVISKVTHATLHSRLREYADVLSERTKGGRLRYSVRQQGAAQGVIAYISQEVWKHVEFVYRLKDGTICGTYANSIFPYWQNVVTSPSDLMESAHVWEGTEKLFTDWCPVKHS